MLVVVAPGQGAQTPGMFNEWLELPAFAEIVAQASAATKLDLRALGTTADADAIRNTAVAQPLIVAAGLGTLAASANLGLPVSSANVDLVAGHSVGEFTAAAAAGVLSVTDALRVVAVRGEAMAHAAGRVATGMSAVLGGEAADVIAAIEAAGLTPANVNGASQIVAAGELAKLEDFAANPPAGTKVRPLPVAGAFHTNFMASAQQAVADAVAAASLGAPSVRLISNRDGGVLTDATEIALRLSSQVTSPVRWDLCMTTFAELGVTGLVELFPGGTLTGIAKRALPGVELLPIKTPADLALLPDFARTHVGK